VIILPAKTIMIQGTTSDAGKSFFVAAMCRIFSDIGYTVAPFKSQNMSLNSGVTDDGSEIARSQIVQALAARVTPNPHHNPVLLKPKGEDSAQIILMGKPFSDYRYEEYYTKYVPMLIPHVKESLEFLLANNDVVVIEGAGSPAEINLMGGEIANMFVAKLVNSPVILVADIDRGGVFASIYGTIKLLPPEEQDLIIGFVINKFRGDFKILQPGIEQIEKMVGKKSLGVVPYISNLKLPAEDSENLQKTNQSGILDLKIIRLPQISNFTDFESLAWEPSISVTYVDDPSELGTPDAVIIPGTKNTVMDYLWFDETGFSAKIKELHDLGVFIVGICGGYQFLGEQIVDSGVEGGSPSTYPALGLLPVRTEFKEYEKITQKARATVIGLPELNGLNIEGYEIHMGRVWPDADARPFLQVEGEREESRSGIIGTISDDGTVIGTFLHGFWDSDEFRHKFIEFLFARKNQIGLQLKSPEMSYHLSIEQSIQEIAKTVKQNIDLDYICQRMGL
jgi:adenosylcobyric acid synthase